ncbi:hypothetical protein [Arthrobacter sulfonylureivorans]|uniref:VanZ-like domain-containing protein n=1 Tax=Arthrobacter sulfonylureivorans TaxID=2486855 RepID=A0ABY3WA61_9MICC|nr:hypothetical protein [Arthrobacter sulfonylureivorans]UNK45212.1 hypothetical protein MNQ99_14890 [Arthrobacter sulfonylureivorans]
MSTPGKRPGPAQDRWYAADAGRLLGAVLVAASWLVAGWPAAAAMLLVCGGQWLLRWYLLDRPVDAVGQLVLLAAGWFSAVGLYHQVSWLDAVMHALASLVVALLVAELLRAELLARGTPASGGAAGSLSGSGGRGGWTGVVMPAVVLVCATVTLGVVWELGEWLGHAYITPEIGVGYDDTIGDLAANFVGAVLGAALSVHSRRTRHGHTPHGRTPPDHAYRPGHNGKSHGVRRRGAAVAAALASGHVGRR